MKEILIYITLVVLVFSSCKEVDLMPPEVEDPVFSVAATLDGLPLNWQAGEEDFFMFTDFSKDEFDVYSMRGRLAKDVNCTSECEESLSFSIRSSYATPSANDFNIDQAMQVGSFDYMELQDSTSVGGYRYLLQGIFEDTIFGNQAASYLWEISDGGSYFETDSMPNPMFEYSGNADLDVKLTTTTPNGCASSIEQKLYLGQPNNCELNIEVSFIDSNEISFFTYFQTPSNNDSILWNNSLTDTFIIAPNLPFNGPLTLLAANDFCEIDMEICLDYDAPQQGNLIGIGIPKINYQVEEITNVIDEQFSSILIEYQDEAGMTYTSEAAENNNNTFTISKIEDFEDNQNGEPTKKVTIDFQNCMLKNEATGLTKMISGSGVIAVAFP